MLLFIVLIKSFSFVFFNKCDHSMIDSKRLNEYQHSPMLSILGFSWLQSSYELIRLGISYIDLKTTSYCRISFNLVFSCFRR